MTAQLVDTPAAVSKGPTATWGLALRIARREARRAPGRTATVFAMIMLPVLVVVAGATLVRTALIDDVEALPYQLGQADAAVSTAYGTEECCATSPGPEAAANAPETIKDVLGPDTRIVRMDSTFASSSAGWQSVAEADLRDPMLDGMVELMDGRLPETAGEAVVSRSTAERAPIGTTITLGRYGEVEVVGVISGGWAGDRVIAAPGSLARPVQDSGGSTWLVDAPDGVDQEDVDRLNAAGLDAMSRQLIVDGPGATEPTPDGYDPTNSRLTWAALAGLGVGIVLLELVLLAGPAFAVGAARQSRAMGLMAAQGCDRRGIRRIVLAQSVVVGGAAVVAGGLLGVLLPLAAYPWIREYDAFPGPFEFSVADAVVAMVFGLLAAVLAGLLPARAVARIDPAAAIAGRRPQPRRLHWHSTLGAVLIVAGWAVVIAALLLGDRIDQLPALVAATGAFVSVVGAVLVAPAAVAFMARAADRAPMALRYALRDLGRNQMRTVPAVAAVSVVVAGAMAVGVIVASDMARSKAQYTPAGPPGDAVVTLGAQSSGDAVSREQWQQAQALVTGTLPDARVFPVQGMAPYGAGPILVMTSSDLSPVESFTGSPGEYELSGAGATQPWYVPNLVGASGIDAVADALSPEARAQAESALAAGRVVILTSGAGPTEGAVRFDVVRMDPDTSMLDDGSMKTIDAIATAVRVETPLPPAQTILPDALARDSGATMGTAALVVDAPQPLTATDQEQLTRQLLSSPGLLSAGVSPSVSVQPAEWSYELLPVLAVLLCAACALVLVGAVTASLLALQDARQDLVTLGEIGAANSIRRRIAAGYGGAITVLGAVIGVIVGCVPGIVAVLSYRPGLYAQYGHMPAGTYLRVPWLVMAVLLAGLPLLVSAVMFCSVRSRTERRLRTE